MKILKIGSYIFSIAFTMFVFISYIYITSKTPTYKVNLPKNINGDIISGDINGDKSIYIYLSKECIYCEKWEKENKKDFEYFAKKDNLKITYRNINSKSPLMMKDKNTQLFFKNGIFNTPSYVYQDYYYRGGPTPEQILLLTKKK